MATKLEIEEDQYGVLFGMRKQPWAGKNPFYLISSSSVFWKYLTGPIETKSSPFMKENNGQWQQIHKYKNTDLYRYTCLKNELPR